jgi:hypothetical protein
MSDSIDPLEGEPRRDVNPTRSADPIQPSWLTAPYADERYLVPDEPEPVVHQERLFSRRVLFGWAFATLVVVFAVTVILPMVVPLVRETVIESVVGRMNERGMNVRVNGHTVAPAVPAAAPVAPPASGHRAKTPTPATTDRR